MWYSFISLFVHTVERGGDKVKEVYEGFPADSKFLLHYMKIWCKIHVIIDQLPKWDCFNAKNCIFQKTGFKQVW